MQRGGTGGKSGLANYTRVITLDAMVGTSVAEATSAGPAAWWSCEGCGSYAELPAEETAGFTIECPDCPGVMIAQWEWDAA